jgi:AraC-like DNA-binding protein
MGYEGSVLVVTGAAELALFGRFETHTHDVALLSWSETSTVTIGCVDRDWIVPPGHGMWMPAGFEHSFEIVRPGTGSALAFDPGDCPIDWDRPSALVSTPLVAELIRYLATLAPGTDRQRHAEAVLFDVLEPAPATTILLPLPEDDRLRTIADRLLADPSDDRDLAHWAHEVGAGVRTLSRLFAAQTGMTFAQWRTNARIRAAVSLLADGLPVGTVARRVGYTKPSAFTEAFRRVTGQRPPTFLPTG